MQDLRMMIAVCQAEVFDGGWVGCWVDGWMCKWLGHAPTHRTVKAAYKYMQYYMGYGFETAAPWLSQLTNTS